MGARITLVVVGFIGGAAVAGSADPNLVLPGGMAGAFVAWLASRPKTPARPRATVDAMTGSLPPSPLPGAPSATPQPGSPSEPHRDELLAIAYASELLREARARGVIDAATRSRLETVLEERRARVPIPPPPVGSLPLPTSAAAGVPVDIPVPATQPFAPAATRGAASPLAVPRAAGPRPSHAMAWFERTRELVVSDLAVHGLAYLGVLLLFVGTLGFLLFSFRSIQIGLRPVAELALPGGMLASAWFLRRRGAPFVATALGLLGGLLLPMFAYASFVDGVSFPPELEGGALVAALVGTSVAIGLAYAAYSVREPEASLRYLVAPMGWLAVWAAGLLLAAGPGEEIDLRSWSAGQLALTTAAVTATVLLARVVPRGRFSAPTLVAAFPGLAFAYGLTVVLSGSEGWPAAPLAIAGVAALLAIELETERLGREVAALLQAVVLGATAVAIGGALEPGWGGAIAAAGFLALLERHARSEAGTRALAIDAAGLLAALGFAYVAPWPAVASFAVASAWAHARRLRPPAIPYAKVVFTIAAYVLPVGLAVGLVWALPDGLAMLILAAGLAVGSGLVRGLAPDDPFYRTWIPQAAGLVALGTVHPSLNDGEAAIAAAVSGLALAAVPGLPVVRLWTSAAALAWAAWRAMEYASLTGPQRSIAWSLAGVALVAVGSSTRSRPGGHAAAVGALAALGGLLSSSDEASRTVGLAAWTAAWLVTVVMNEARARGLAALLPRAAARVGGRRLERLAVVVPPVVLLASAPLLVADVCDQVGITSGRRSWTGVAISATALGYGLAARWLASRRPLAPILAVSAFALSAVGISVAAPDPWPSIAAVAGLIGVTFSLGAELRRPIMAWVAWVASGVLAVLLANRAGVPLDGLPPVVTVWGAVLLAGGLVLDGRLAGRRRAGEGVRTRWLWAPVAVGALGFPLGLSLAFPQGPDVYGPWSIAAAVVYLLVALLLRAGSVTVASWALLTVGVATFVPSSPFEHPLLFVPWAGALASCGVVLGLANRTRDRWLRWDLPPLIVAHAVAGVALVRSLDVGTVTPTWAGLGALALALAVIRRNVAWGVAGAILLVVAAEAAGPEWFALALGVSSCATAAASIRTSAPTRWAMQATSGLLAAGAWWQLAVWREWPPSETAVATAGVAAVLVLSAGALARRARSPLDRAVALGALGLAAGNASLVVAASPGAALDRAGIASLVASVTGSWALALGVSARRMGLPGLREGSALLAVATGLALAIGYDVEVGRVVAAAAATGLAATVGAVALWRVRPASTWLLPLGIVAGASDLAGAVLAVTSPERRDLLVAMLLVSAAEAAAAGIVLRHALLLALSPILACAAWLLVASELLRGEPQWFTVPIGLALLLVVAVARWALREREKDPRDPTLIRLELVGMALMVGASLVEVFAVGPVRGLVAVAAGVGLATWGGLTRVRRRVLFGAATTVLALFLIVAGPIARLVPKDATAIWILLVVAGAVLVTIATMIERFRAGVAQVMNRVETLMEGWE